MKLLGLVSLWVVPGEAWSYMYRRHVTTPVMAARNESSLDQWNPLLDHVRPIPTAGTESILLRRLQGHTNLPGPPAIYCVHLMCGRTMYILLYTVQWSEIHLTKVKLGIHCMEFHSMLLSLLQLPAVIVSSQTAVLCLCLVAWVGHIPNHLLKCFYWLAEVLSILIQFINFGACCQITLDQPISGWSMKNI